VDVAFLVREGPRLIVVALLLLTVGLECALHLADHSAAAAVDAITVAVEAAIIAAVLSLETLAAIVPLGTIEAFEALRTFEAFWPFGAFLRSLRLAILASLGAAIEAFSAIVSTIVSAFDALESFRTVIADDAFVSLCALETFWAISSVDAISSLCAVDSIDALGTVDAIRAIGSIGAFDARRPFGALGSFLALGPVGEFASLRRRVSSFGPLAAAVAIVDLVDASCVDAHGCVVRICGSYRTSAAAGAWARASRRLRV
jgi:hypothetical protein